MTLTQAQRTEIVALYLRGVRVVEIANLCGTTAPAVVVAAKKAGCPMRGRGYSSNFSSAIARPRPARPRGARPPVFDMPEDAIAFWPTRRDSGIPALPPANFNCQRCGESIDPRCGWWCDECANTIRHLQETRAMSMVQIAGAGEYDPQWSAITAALAPWMIPMRQQLYVHADEAEQIRKRGNRRLGAA